MTTSATPDVSTAQEVAEALDRALRTGIPVPPPSATHPGLDLTLAYDVQQININKALARGDLVTGHKIGLTSVAMQQLLGVDSPDFGVLLASMAVEDGMVAPQALLQPRIEAEIAFLLGKDLDGSDPSVDDVLAATAAVMPALEVIDSRVANWRITLPDTVADNASSGAYALGAALPVDGDLREVALRLDRNGVEVASGRGSAALGHPAEAVRWLARTLHAQGELLRAGSVVLSGAVHAAVPVEPGDTFTVRSSIGTVGLRFPGART